MKIGYKPQKLVKNLVSENFFNNGNSMRRIIEIPAQSAKAGKILDIVYTKTDSIPTQWYVANYNLIRRDKKSTVAKTLTSVKTHPNEIHTVTSRYNQKGYGQELTIDINNGNVIKTSKDIQPENVK